MITHKQSSLLLFEACIVFIHQSLAAGDIVITMTGWQADRQSSDGRQTDKI